MSVGCGRRPEDVLLMELIARGPTCLALASPFALHEPSVRARCRASSRLGRVRTVYEVGTRVERKETFRLESTRVCRGRRHEEFGIGSPYAFRSFFELHECGFGRTWQFSRSRFFADKSSNLTNRCNSLDFGSHEASIDFQFADVYVARGILPRRTNLSPFAFTEVP
jgi:hypothetical protein